MRTLVTGGAGFIGSALVRHLVAAGDTVLTLDALTYAGNLDSLRSVWGDARHQFVHADIRDGAAMGRHIEAFAPDRVLHLAAQSHVDRSISGAGDFVATNIVGTYTLLEAVRAYWDRLGVEAKGFFRFLHVSTDEVFGSLGAEGHFSEDTPYDPSSPYSASKAASDHLVKAWGRTYGLPVLVSNCSNNYGPCQFPEKLIPLTILNALHGEPLPIYGSGANVRDWLYVEDHARALDAISRRGRLGETYAVGGRAERRNIEVVQAVCAVLDRLRPEGAPYARLICHVADRPGHDARYAIDPARIERELGWRAEVSFEQGIEATVRWYLDNEAWWLPLRDRYAGERLGLLGTPQREAAQ